MNTVQMAIALSLISSGPINFLETEQDLVPMWACVKNGRPQWSVSRNPARDIVVNQKLNLYVLPGLAELTLSRDGRKLKTIQLCRDEDPAYVYFLGDYLFFSVNHIRLSGGFYGSSEKDVIQSKLDGELVVEYDAKSHKILESRSLWKHGLPVARMDGYTYSMVFANPSRALSQIYHKRNVTVGINLVKIKDSNRRTIVVGSVAGGKSQIFADLLLNTPGTPSVRFSSEGVHIAFAKRNSIVTFFAN
ncbi:MAG: hypothetical protein J0L72_08200 [Armatimonadetes bacterium]|nr:hypothetical protein [Armatimonadota bacterium]